MAPVIRPLAMSDCARAAAISATATEAWSETALADTLQTEAGRLFGLWLEDRLVGISIFQTVLDEATLEGITLLPEVRGQGLSKAFLAHCLNALTAQGTAFFFLEVRVTNAPAIALYECLGFRRMGLRKGFYRNPAEDAYTYQLAVEQ